MIMTWDYALSLAEARGAVGLTRENLMDLYVSHPAEEDREAIKKAGPALLDMVVTLSNGEDVDVKKEVREIHAILRNMS
jgi:hypothetical protein